jgi:RHS repeat-associated protein
MGIYTEKYEYDAVGNFLKLIHRGANPANPGWTRSYVYNETSSLEAGKVSNRLTSTSVSSSQPLSEPYTYDLHGNMSSMPQLQVMSWNFNNDLLMTQRQAMNASDEDGALHQGERTYYVYDSSGQRVRKTTESSGGIRIKDRIYIGGFELYREYDTMGRVSLARDTLHVMDDQKRVALVETKTVDTSSAPGPLHIVTTRYQFDNHLGTVCLELDENADVITYEEYYPYGNTSYQAGRSLSEVSLKRYRYTGKERDEETGFYYHGARYYAPWLQRWISADPAGMVDGLNLFVYVRNDPIRRTDENGMQSAFMVPGSRDDKLNANSTPDEREAFVARRGKTLHDPDKSNDKWVGNHWDLGPDAWVEPIAAGKSGQTSPGSPDGSHALSGQSAGNSQTNNEEGFWKSIVSGREEAGFWKGLIPILGSVQNANYHFDKGNWVRGTLYTALAISDVFLVRSILTGALKLGFRGVLSLKGVVGTALRELNPSKGIGSGIGLVTKLKRFFVQDLARYSPDASPVLRILREHFKVGTKKGLQSMFEMHHWLIQRRWYEGAKAIKTEWVRKLLQTVGDSGANLIPLHRTLNNVLGRSLTATISFAHKLGTSVVGEIKWAAGNVSELYHAMLPAAQPATQPAR